MSTMTWHDDDEIERYDDDEIEIVDQLHENNHATICGVGYRQSRQR